MNSKESNTLVEKYRIETIFKEINTSLENKSVHELSEDHRVVGIFIKWFGCPM
jgi:hypothetical protein